MVLEIQKWLIAAPIPDSPLEIYILIVSPSAPRFIWAVESCIFKLVKDYVIYRDMAEPIQGFKAGHSCFTADVNILEGHINPLLHLSGEHSE